MKPILVGPDHPAWHGLDDDDWNGATFANWLNSIKGRTVRVEAPANFDKDRLNRMIQALSNIAEAVSVYVELPKGIAYCMDCANKFPDESMRCTKCHGVNITEGAYQVP